MVRVSIRALALATWCVVAALTLGATTPNAGCGAPPFSAAHVGADHPAHAIVAVGGATHARRRAIRHNRTGSRQLSPSHAATIVLAQLTDPASRTNTRHRRVPAHHLLLNLIAPRAPASTLS